MVASILLGLVGIFVAVTGMKCMKCMEDDQVKKMRMAVFGGVIFIISGWLHTDVLSVECAVSRVAHILCRMWEGLRCCSKSILVRELLRGLWFRLPEALWYWHYNLHMDFMLSISVGRAEFDPASVRKGCQQSSPAFAAV